MRFGFREGWLNLNFSMSVTGLLEIMVFVLKVLTMRKSWPTSFYMLFTSKEKNTNLSVCFTCTSRVGGQHVGGERMLWSPGPLSQDSSHLLLILLALFCDNKGLARAAARL